MGYQDYLQQFENAAGRLNPTLLREKQVEVAVVEVLQSVCLKLYKKQWASPLGNPLTAESRIFFSVWISDEAIQAQKIQYNLHAFKLRHLKGYTIQSRKFANVFRNSFKQHLSQWPNVSVNFGPLTLMEGWVTLDLQNIEDDIVQLANRFLGIEHLVDNTLVQFKQVSYKPR